MAATVREVEQHMQGIGRLIALTARDVGCIVVIVRPFKMESGLLGMRQRLVQLTGGGQHRLHRHAKSQQPN